MKQSNNAYHGGLLCLGSGDLGSAIIARTGIQAGDVCGYLTGKLLCFDEMIDHQHSDSIQIGPDLFVSSGFPMSGMNHSCNPNAGLKDDLSIVAIRPISKGEEVRLDYSTTMYQRYFTMHCQCGDPMCRGVITDFDLLPKDLIRAYLKLGIVQSFIKDQIHSSGLFSDLSFRDSENEGPRNVVDLELDKTSRLAKPPGNCMLRITTFLFSSKINGRIFEQIIADLREEYNESYSQGRIWHARWMRFCYTLKFWNAGLSLVSSKAVRAVVAWLWKGC